MIKGSSLIENMYALIACVVDVAPGEYLASTAEQGFQAVQKGEIKVKIDQDDKVDIYKMITQDQTGELDLFEEDKKQFSHVNNLIQSNYNITKDDINSAIKWVEKNRKDVVKKYDNQVSMFAC